MGQLPFQCVYIPVRICHDSFPTCWAIVSRKGCTRDKEKVAQFALEKITSTVESAKATAEEAQAKVSTKREEGSN